MQRGRSLQSLRHRHAEGARQALEDVEREILLLPGFQLGPAPRKESAITGPPGKVS